MTSQVDAQKAISMFNEYKMGERPLTVNLAKPRVERSNSRGGGGGYRGLLGAYRSRPASHHLQC